MIVTCPGCTANYRVRNEQVPAGGAKMRCPKCNTLFLAMLPQELTAEDLLGGAPKTPAAAAPASPAAPKKAPAPIDGLQFSVDFPKSNPTSQPAPPSTAAPPPSGPPAPSPLSAAQSPAHNPPKAASPPSHRLPATSPFTTLPRTDESDLAHQASTSIEQLMGAVGGHMPVRAGVKTGAHNAIQPNQPIDSLAPTSSGDFDPFADMNIESRPPPGLEDGGVQSGLHQMPSNDLGDALPTQYTFEVLEERETSNPQPVAKVALKRMTRDDLRTIQESGPEGKAPAPPTQRVRRNAPAWPGRLFLAIGIVALLLGGVFAGWSAKVLPLDDLLLARFEQWFDLSPPRSARGRDLPAAESLVVAATKAKTAGDLLDELLLHGRILQRGDRGESRARRDEIRVQLGVDRLPD